jgi:predicted nucleotide-binding protein (sugar kinase/HSP70/actin superfamily)
MSKLVKAKVLPYHSYGDAKAGSIVEVEEKELIISKHCLVSLEAEQKKSSEDSKKAEEVLKNKTDEFNKIRDSFAAQAEMDRDIQTRKAEADIKKLQEVVKQNKKP